ncbi:hypothetical protein U0D62_06030 [Aquimarina sp. 2201CG5-10]|nr:hypothetical protein [Aquimarina sp. 2201CG5-10]
MNHISAQKKGQIIETQYFEFHINFWVNLHFYLYETASSSLEKPLEEIIDQSLWKNLTIEEKEIFKNTITYYQNTVDLKNHFSNTLIVFRKWIINYSEYDELYSSQFDPIWLEKLNAFKPVYLHHFWENHLKTNEEKLQENLMLIKATENIIIPQIATLAQTKWQKNKIRIDLSVKSPGGGAFTLGRVPSSIVMSTIVDYKEIPGDWVETLFHEASHTVIKGHKGAITQSINRISEKLNQKPPKNLWHALLFYTAGKVCRDAFLQQKIDSYSLYMDRENIFEFYQGPIYKYFTPYLDKKTDLDSAIENTLVAINNKISHRKSIKSEKREEQQLNGSEILQKSIQFYDPKDKWGSIGFKVHIQEPRVLNPLRYSIVTLNNNDHSFELHRSREKHISTHLVDNNGKSVTFLDGKISTDSIQIKKYRLQPERNYGYQKFYQYLLGIPMSLNSKTIDYFEKTEEVVFNKTACYKIALTLKEAMFSKHWVLYISKQNYEVIGLEMVFPEDESKGERLYLSGNIEINGVKIIRTKHWHEYKSDEYSGSDIIVKELERK